MERQYLQIWDEALNILESELPTVGYETWVKTLVPVDVVNNTFFLMTNMDFNQNLITTRYSTIIQNVLYEITKNYYDIEIIIPEQSIETEVKKTPANSNGLNVNYVFDTFVVGSGNQLAHAAAIAVSEAPAAAYNPLFLYGGVGLGKTHLMHAVAHYILKLNNSSKVLYVSCETFTNELIEAIKHNKNEAFRKKYREIDVLLIDDIQFLSGKDKTQEEFFHTFNTLKDANKQIVISSDRPPHEIEILEERLSSRFRQAFICDLKPPDLETRIAILTKKAERNGDRLPNNVIEYIARSIVDDIRALEGALTSVVAYSKFTKVELNIELAENVLHDIVNDTESRTITIELIQEVVANHFGIKPEDIRSSRKVQKLTYPRQIAMYLSRKILDVTFDKIGDSFGGKHYSTIMHGCEKIENDIESDQKIKKTVEELEKKLTTKFKVG